MKNLLPFLFLLSFVQPTVAQNAFDNTIKSFQENIGIDSTIIPLTAEMLYLGEVMVNNGTVCLFLNQIGNNENGVGMNYLNLDEPDCKIIGFDGTYRVKVGCEKKPTAGLTYPGAKALLKWLQSTGRMVNTAKSNKENISGEM